MYEELNKKLAEWRWPNARVYIPRVGGEIRVVINGQTTQYGLFTDPEWGIAYCFKWLVPKLLEKELSVSITVNVANSLAIVRDKFDKTPAIWKENHREHPALALCLAIEKLIDGGN